MAKWRKSPPRPRRPKSSPHQVTLVDIRFTIRAKDLKTFLDSTPSTKGKKA